MTMTAIGGTGLGLGCAAGPWARAAARKISNSIVSKFKGGKKPGGFVPGRPAYDHLKKLNVKK
jgi:hypothetical protein